MSEESMTYVAHEPCGCLVWAQVDVPESAKRVANEVAKMIRTGYHPTRITTEQVRTMEWRCAEYPSCAFGQRQTKPRERKPKRTPTAMGVLL